MAHKKSSSATLLKISSLFFQLLCDRVSNNQNFNVIDEAEVHINGTQHKKPTGRGKTTMYEMMIVALSIRKGKILTLRG